MRRLLQRSLHCRCGNQRILARGFVSPPATRCDGRIETMQLFADPASSLHIAHGLLAIA